MCWLYHRWGKWKDIAVDMWSIEAKRKYVQDRQIRRCADCNKAETRKV